VKSFGAQHIKHGERHFVWKGAICHRGGEFRLGKTSGLKVIRASDGEEGRDMHALNEALTSHCTAIQGTSRERLRKEERKKESFRYWELYSKETRPNGR